MKHIIAAALLLAATTAHAQDIQTYTSFPLGNSLMTIGPDGYSSTTYPLGNGYVTNVNPGYLPPSPQVYQPNPPLPPFRPLPSPQGYR